MNTSIVKLPMKPLSSTSRIALLPVGIVLSGLAVAPGVEAAPKKATPTRTAPSAPVSLGNNVFLLGDETGSISPASKKAAPSSLPQLKAAPKANFNALLLNFCRSYLGRKLGNGQCSELVMLGLPAVGAQCDLNRQWGTPVCNYGASNGRQFIQVGSAGRSSKNPRRLDVRPGDIIQYENVKFERNWNGGYSFREYPHHTSVIERVSRDGRTYDVLEQNVNGTQYVLRTRLYLPELTQGILHITRPTSSTSY